MSGRVSTPDGGRILLVCIPGTLCTGRAFDGVIRELRQRGYAVRSQIVDSSQFRSSREVALDAAREVELAEGERLIIAGFSLGGSVAAQLAILLAKDLAGVVLLDVNGEADRPENAPNRRAAVERARQTGVRHFIIEETWPTHVAAANLGNIGLRDDVVCMAEDIGVEGFANQAEIAISRPRTIDALQSTTAPILVLCGEEDRITPLAMSQAIASSVHHGQLEVVKGAGHFAIMEKPDVIAAIIGKWIAAVTTPSYLPI